MCGLVWYIYTISITIWMFTPKIIKVIYSTNYIHKTQIHNYSKVEYKKKRWSGKMVPLVFKIVKSCERCWGGWVTATSFTKETCSAITEKVKNGKNQRIRMRWEEIIVLPGMEEEEEIRREAAWWLRNRGTALLRELPPHNTPPLIFISEFFFILLHTPYICFYFLPKYFFDKKIKIN